MRDNRVDDLRAGALGIGAALVLYYGYAASLVADGNVGLDRPVTWMGLASGIAAIGWSMTTASRRRATPPAAS